MTKLFRPNRPVKDRTTPRLVPPDRKHPSYGIVWAELPVGATKWVTRRRSTNCTEREEAEKVLQEFLGGFLLERAGYGEKTFGELAQLYLDEHCAAKGTRLERTQRYSLRAPVLAFAEREPDELRPQVWDAYAKSRRRGEYAGAKPGPVSSSTIRREIGAALAVLNWAAKTKGLIPASHVHPAPLPEAGQRREVWLDEDQLEEVLERALQTATQDVLIAVWLWAFTGARREAVLELEWDRVSWSPDPGKLDFRQPGRHTGRKRRAVVPIAKRLRPVLVSHWRSRGEPGAGKVVTSGDHSAFYRRFRKWADAEGFTELTPHVFRHTFITLRLRAGRDPWKIAGLVNEDLDTLLRVYGHHRPDHLTDTLDI